MSLDSDISASSGSGRDWFFPSPSFFRSSSSQHGRRFYSNSKPYSPPSSSRPPGIRHRRRVKVPCTSTPIPTKEEHQISDTKYVSDKPSAKKKLIRLSQFRCQIALVVCSSSLSLSSSLLLFLIHVGVAADFDYSVLVAAAAPKYTPRKPSKQVAGNSCTCNISTILKED